MYLRDLSPYSFYLAKHPSNTTSMSEIYLLTLSGSFNVPAILAKSRHKRELNSRSADLQADALTTRPMRRSGLRKATRAGGTYR